MADHHHIAHSLVGVERTEDISMNEDVTFDGLLLSENILKGLKKCGFKKPSPIQLTALPLGKCGFDLIVEAKSGTGKTAVFGITALEMLVMSVNCQVVIVAPTREIASQIGQVITSIGSAIEGLRVEVVMGGTSMSADVDRLRNKKYQILVGSPGRLKHLIKEKAVSLDAVRLFVLDEADKLMEESFQHDINYIFKMLPERKQVIVASATYTPEMRDFLSLYMRSPSHICPYSSTILIGVNQFISVVPTHLNVFRQTTINFDELKRILSEVPYKQCLVFCNYQSTTRNTCRKLCEDGWPAEYLASSQTQSERLKSLKKLKAFTCRVLVATDLAARGIDAANVDLVVNLGSPYDTPTYLHRIGRAGRYGSKGTAITILPFDQEEKFKSLFENFGDNFEIKPLRVLSRDIPAKEVKLDSPKVDFENFKYDNSLMSLMVSPHQCDRSVENFDELIQSFDAFQCKHVVTHDTFDSLLDSLNNFDDACASDNQPEDASPNLNNVIAYLNSTVKGIEKIKKCFTQNANVNLDLRESSETPASVERNEVDKCFSDSKSDGLTCLAEHGNDLVNRNKFDPSECSTARSRQSKKRNKDVKRAEKISFSKSNKLSDANKYEKGQPMGIRDISRHSVNDGSYVNKNVYFVSADEYLRWKSHLSCITQYIQDSVYMNTLFELNNSSI